ncbi:MAG: PAS domain-containing protein [Acidimicrobiales bacterium]
MPGEDGLDPRLVAEAVEQAPDAVVVVDAAGTVRYWNRGAQRIFGFTPDQMLGSSLDPIIPERLRQRHDEGFRAAVSRGSSRYGDHDLLAVPATAADGRTVSIEFTVVLLSTGDGKIGHVAAFIRDVTERRAREQELRRRLQALEPASSTGP